jgi:GT2 family glycosyltransferase
MNVPEKLLTISIISSDDINSLDRCLDRTFSKTGKDIPFEVHVVNNNSGPATTNMVNSKYPQVKLTENGERKGFSENHNIVIRQSSSEYILFMNPDIFIEDGFIKKLLDAIARDMKIGAVMGKLMRGDGSSIIDSTGLIILKSRRTLDRGQGEDDRGQYFKSDEIFSTSGAAMLCRRKMLEDIKLFNEYFDESFKLYKEDLDICWRARLRGWKIVYVPDAVAYHARGWGKDKKRSAVPRWIRRESFKNRYLTIIKNDHLSNFLKDLPFILLHEFMAMFYVVFREPHLFLAWFQIIKLIPLTLRKRAEIMKRAVVGADDIHKWFS